MKTKEWSKGFTSGMAAACECVAQGCDVTFMEIVGCGGQELIDEIRREGSKETIEVLETCLKNKYLYPDFI